MKRRRDSEAQLPPLCQNIDRVSRIVVLGITINDRMTATDHISGLIDSSSRMLYALRVLRDHGMPSTSLQDVFRASCCTPLQHGQVHVRVMIAGDWMRFRVGAENYLL